MSHKPRYIILIIRIRYDLVVVLVWIICSPRQNIGGGFTCLQVSMLIRACAYVKDHKHLQFQSATHVTLGHSKVAHYPLATHSPPTNANQASRQVGSSHRPGGAVFLRCRCRPAQHGQTR
jgi:hypothetical protein